MRLVKSVTVSQEGTTAFLQVFGLPRETNQSIIPGHYNQ